MQLSDITNQSGLVQSVEFWARLPYGSSGNTLKEIINRINRGYDSIMPLLLSNTDEIRWDDTNNTDAPIGYVNIVSGQPDYKITADDNGLDILNLSRVRIHSSATDTVYTELQKMTMDDGRALDAMSPNTAVTGIPSHFLEVGNIYYLYPNPNYSSTNGMELFFERQQNYFTVTGTSASDTTEPGIPSPFHELLALYAAKDWVMVNRPEDSATINNIVGEILKKEKNLTNSITMRNPTRSKMTMKRIKHR